MNIYAHPHICVERDDNGKIVFEKVEKRKKIQDTSSRPHVIHHFTLINIFRNYEILFFFFYLEILFAVAKRIYYTIIVRFIKNIYINLLYDDIK